MSFPSPDGAAPGRRGGPWLAVIFGGAAVALGLVSLVNHYLFRTHAYDLGLFNHALWDYAHLRGNANSVKRFDNILADHFTVLQIGFAPLWWLFRSWTLLLIQLAAVLVGGWGAWRLHVARLTAIDATASLAPARWLTLHFFSTWGIWSALTYDYHDNVVAAMLLPWLLLAFYQRRGGLALLIALLMLLAKENMALWLVGIGLGLAWLYRADPRRRNWALALSAVSAAYFKVITGVLMPALSATGTYLYTDHYAAVGRTFGAVAQTLLTRPLFALRLLWEPFPAQPEWAAVKPELHLLVLGSGGLALLRRPAYALMLGSIYAQKLLSSLPGLWGISYQYSIEFVPVLNAALGHWLLSNPAPSRRVWPSAAAAIAALLITQITLKTRYSPAPDPAQARWLSSRHYRRGFDVRAVHRALALVPPDVPVSAQNVLVPHLADRSICYLFPFVGEAEYVVLLPTEDPYPLTDSTRHRTLTRMRRSGAWEEVRQAAAPTLLILRRRQPVVGPPYPRRCYAGHPVELADSLVLSDFTEPAFRRGL